ncbi:MAG: hypothetical protein D3910_05635 [Candidatus Electrothrix sp. ATG2]|nr:hypothetical protein [Candidatus Electrothrix sp. ATG2]
MQYIVILPAECFFALMHKVTLNVFIHMPELYSEYFLPTLICVKKHNKSLQQKNTRLTASGISVMMKEKIMRRREKDRPLAA